jgi:hypothetical protein
MATMTWKYRERNRGFTAPIYYSALARGSFSAGYHGLLQKNPRTCRGIRGEQVLGKNPNTSYIGGYAAHEVPSRSTFFQLLRPSNDGAAYRYYIGADDNRYHIKIQ